MSSRAQRGICSLALRLGASTVGAQTPLAEGERTVLIEAELLGGYTPVGLEKWTGTFATASDFRSFGAIVRIYPILIGSTRVGLEVGSQHFFTWKERFSSGATIVTTTHHVGGLHLALVARACERPRFDCDAGYGLHFLGESALPGVHFGMNYIVIRSKRFRVPVGARVALILSDQSTALPLAIKTGFTF